MSEYEKLRAKNVLRNQQLLEELELGPSSLSKELKAARKNMQPKKKPRPPQQRTRVSARAQLLPPPTYTEVIVQENNEAKERAAQVKREKAIGARLSDGRWRGEKFGTVKGVQCGHVFGRGDYQREGRKEMMENGFFRPFVTPEWVERNKKGCFALILNNDNGLSEDNGTTILYAGSGGRQRGQNRMAPQSFHQGWDNITNNALRRNCQAGKKMPVRVIRGPKLSSRYGTACAGGGYRYDGLYEVVNAELVKGKCKHNKSLLTAMFLLRRLENDGYDFTAATEAAQNSDAALGGVRLDSTVPGDSDSESSGASTEMDDDDDDDDDVPVADIIRSEKAAAAKEAELIAAVPTASQATKRGLQKDAAEENSTPGVGTRVEVRFDDGQLYCGTIRKVSSDPSGKRRKKKQQTGGPSDCSRTRVKIEYDDGDVEWGLFPDPDIKVL